MNSFSKLPLLIAILFALACCPPRELHSQLAPLPDDPLAALQVLQKANDDLLKRQDDSLKSLTELTNAANEIRVFSRRG